MGILAITVLLLYATGEMSGLVHLEPMNNAVLQGSAAHFNCSLEGDWVAMAWLIDSSVVLTITRNNGPISNSPRYSANNCSSGLTHCWEFVINDVQRNDSGTVTCDVQNIQTQKAQLSVQESGTVSIVGGNVTVIHGHRAEFQCVASGWFPEPTVNWATNWSMVDVSHYNTSTEPLGSLFNTSSVLSIHADISTTVECLASVPALTTPLFSSIYLIVEPVPQDWTVLIAVLCSVGGFILLVLLILLIIFCCKCRKETKSGYDEEMRRARTHSQLSTISRSGQISHVNMGYATEDQTSVPPSEFNDSGYSQTNYSNHLEIPDDVQGNQAANGYSSEFHATHGSGFKKHRHVTIV